MHVLSRPVLACPTSLSLLLLSDARQKLKSMLFSWLNFSPALSSESILALVSVGERRRNSQTCFFSPDSLLRGVEISTWSSVAVDS